MNKAEFLTGQYHSFAFVPQTGLKGSKEQTLFEKTLHIMEIDRWEGIDFYPLLPVHDLFSFSF